MLHARRQGLQLNFDCLNPNVLLSGGYIGFLPTHFAAHWLDTGELVEIDAGLRRHWDFELVVRRASVPSAALRAFLADLRTAGGR